MNIGKQLKEGLLTRNPVTVRLLGVCAALAVTTSLRGGLGMGICVLTVLTLSNALLSALWAYLPRPIQTISAVAVVATLGAVADLVIQAFLPELAGELGLFLPLAAATCVLLSGGGAFAYENPVAVAAVEGLCQGAGYTLVLVLTGAVRELLGTGIIGFGLFNAGRGLSVFPGQFAAGAMVGPVGGFLALGFVAAAMQFVGSGSHGSGRKKEAEKG